MQRIIIVSVLPAVLGWTAVATAAAILPAGASAVWRFDNMAVPVPDSSGHSNDLVHSSGTYSWTTNTWQTITSGAVRFPTDAATNDGLQCNSGSLGNVDPGGTGTSFAISVALTIKPDAIPSGHAGDYWVVQKMNYCDKANHTTGTLGVGWGIYVNFASPPGRAYFCFYDEDGKYKEARSDNVIDANETIFLAVTHDYNQSSAGSGFTNWYINDGSGMIHDTLLHEYDKMETSTNELVSVGYPRGGSGRTTRGYCGVVDDVVIWENVLLNASQVADVYDWSKLPEPTSLVLLGLGGLGLLMRRRR